MKICKRH